MDASIDDNLIVCRELDKALEILTESDRFKHRIETIWNCGGREVYQVGLAHPWMHKLVLTRIERDYDCDLKFPDVDWSQFELNEDFSTDGLFEDKGVRWKVSSYTKKA